MAWKDSSELVVGADGGAYFAPLGTALPALGADPDAALNPAFVGAGFLTEDGFTTSIGSEVTDFMSWQSLDPTRSERTGQVKSITFTMQQWNEENIVFAFGGGEVEDAGGGNFGYAYPEGDEALEERSLVIDAIDGDVKFRFVFARVSVREPVDSQFQRAALGLLPVTARVLRPEDEGRSAYFNTNAPGFAAGS